MTEFNRHKEMLHMVTQAMGDDLIKDVVFVGGCTTGFLLTDSFALEQVRFTDDVDLIAHILNHGDWYELLRKLKTKGFKENSQENNLCAMKLGELKIDIMPDDPKILGFSNPWYREALTHAVRHQINNYEINIISPVYFVATKLVAYEGRGNNDPLESRDIEDLLILFDGRNELLDEIQNSSKDIQDYISSKIQALFANQYFSYAIQSVSKASQDREDILTGRLKSVCI